MSSSKLKYTLPDFADAFAFNIFFLQQVSNNPVLLQDGVVLDSIYGCFPNCSFNGGRPFVREPYSRKEIEEIFQAIAEFGIHPRLTMTNMLLQEEDLQDPYANEILEIGSRYGAEAIVYDDMVGDYIRDTYGMKLVLSTTREIDDVDEFNRLAEDYDYIVLNYNFNKDRTFIDAIEDKSKVEVMVNEFCEKNCPRRRDHYLHNSQDQLENTLHPYNCYADKFPTFLEHAPDDPVFFTNDEVFRLNEETGIQYFKIVGRGVPFEVVLDAYTYYLIKPEYREDVKQLITDAAG